MVVESVGRAADHGRGAGTQISEMINQIVNQLTISVNHQLIVNQSIVEDNIYHAKSHVKISEMINHIVNQASVYIISIIIK